MVEILQAIDRWRHAPGSPEPDVLAETLTKTHGTLLAEAWVALDGELRERGNNPAVLRLLQTHSRRITGYWRARVEKYLEFVAPQSLQAAPTIGLRGEDIRVQVDSDGERITIERKTPTEKDTVNLDISGSGEITDALGPQIVSEVRPSQPEPPEVRYKMNFRDGVILNFERVTYHDDPEFERPSAWREEKLNFSGWHRHIKS